MYNLYSGKKLVASFVRLKDAHAYVKHVLFSDFQRKSFYLIAVDFPRHGEPQKYTFGRLGNYVVISIIKKL